jgi:hypothetical protein
MGFAFSARGRKSLVTQMAKHPTTKTAPAKKRRPGRPRSSPLDPIEQARARRRRHRESKRNAGMVPAEIWLPQAWRDAVIARGETLQDAAQEAFRLLMAHWEKRSAKRR